MLHSLFCRMAVSLLYGKVVMAHTAMTPPYRSPRHVADQLHTSDVLMVD